MPPPKSDSTPPLTFLITGATSGFGLEIARLALAAGHVVVGTSRDPASHPLLAQEFASTGRGQLLPLDMSSSLPSSTTTTNSDDGAEDNPATRLIATLTSRGTQIDVLVSNAGAALLSPAESVTESEVRSQLEANYLGPYRLMRAVVPLMRARRRGAIISVATGAAVDGRDGMGAYAGSKAATDALLRIWAKELAPFGVRCLTVHLGAFDTNFVGASVSAGARPPPPDYDDQAVSEVLGGLRPNSFAPDGDHKKASRAIYEMIVGEGLGEGKEDERVMYLGRDMWKLMERVAANTKHAMDTFENVCNNVYIEKA
ncbi:hypothetical protein N3K66_005483 [Trichothecium roseum]|uniref:Uncharacterized protein n=1 Tax=Trichothecium roseum TaxID=47278 RepID=A0ACC0UZP1_9HYPO|nr:hypothetical protein N3K66_005483 [Trichothecium roseum]